MSVNTVAQAQAGVGTLMNASVVVPTENKLVLTRSWRVVRSHQSSYRGGKAILSADGRFLACWDADQIKFLDMGSGQIIKSIETGEDDLISSFTLSPNQKILYTAHTRSFMIKQWNIATGEMIRQWRAHDMPVLDLATDPTGNFLASASVDRSVRVWDTRGGFCTHNLTDHAAMVTKVYVFFREVRVPVEVEAPRAKSGKSDKQGKKVLKEWQTIKVHQVLACSEGGEVKLWTLGSGPSRPNTSMDLKNHLSTVTSAVLMDDGFTLVTAGRDSVVSAWNLDVINCTKSNTVLTPEELSEAYPNTVRHPKYTGKLLQTAIPVFEAIEGIVGLKPGFDVASVRGVVRPDSKSMKVPPSNSDLWVLIAGDKGMIRVWSLVNRRPISTLIFGAIARKLADRTQKPKEETTQTSKDVTNLLSVDASLVQSPDATLSKRERKAKVQAEAEAKEAADASNFPLPTEPAPAQFALLSLFFFAPSAASEVPSNDEGDGDDGNDHSTSIYGKQTDPTAHLSEAVYTGVDRDRYEELGIIVPEEVKDQDKKARAMRLRQEKKAARQAEREARVKAKLATLHEMDEDEEMDDESSDNDDEDDAATEEDAESEQQVFVPKAPFDAPYVIALTGEQNIVCFELKTLEQRKLLVGFNDDVVDIKPIPHSTYIVVATNSSQIRIFNTQDMSAVLLSAHTDIVVALDVSPCGRWLASCGKDRTVCVWLLPPHYSVPTKRAADQMVAKAKAEKTTPHLAFTITEPVLVAMGTGHTEAVTSIVFSRKQLPQADEPCPAGGISHFYIVTGSSDRTIKHWNLMPLLPLAGYEFFDSANNTGHLPREVKLQYAEMGNPSLHKIFNAISTPVMIRSLHTVLGHEKDINCLTISRDDRYLASASQDRSIKIWSPDSLKLIAVMRGHKRSVWTVAFSPIEKLLASTSSDKTIKLWSLNDFSCVKTLEGHTTAVVKATFISAGLQLFTSDAEGAIKLWNIADSECVKTFTDVHTNRVWALSTMSLPEPDGPIARKLRKRGYNVTPPLHIVTGGTDSTIAVWRDVTLEEDASKEREDYLRSLKEQALANALRKKDFKESFTLALALNQPRRVYAVLSDLNDAETRYKRWRHLDRVRAKLHEERVARRKAARERAAKLGKANAGDDAHDSSDSEDDEPFLSIEAREELLMIVPKPSTTMEALAKSMSIEDLTKVLKYIQDWNANSRYAHIAQRMLNAILTNLSPEVLKQVKGIKEIISAIVAYSQRHFVRVDNLLRKSYMIDYTLQSSTFVLPIMDATSDMSEAKQTDSKASQIVRGRTRAERMLNALSLAVDGSDLEDEIISETEDDELAQDELSDDEIEVETKLAELEDEPEEADMSIFAAQPEDDGDAGEESESESLATAQQKGSTKRIRMEPSEDEIQAALKRIETRLPKDGSRILVPANESSDGSDSEIPAGFDAAMFETNWESDDGSDSAEPSGEESDEESEIQVPVKKGASTKITKTVASKNGKPSKPVAKNSKPVKLGAKRKAPAPRA